MNRAPRAAFGRAPPAHELGQVLDGTTAQLAVLAQALAQLTRTAESSDPAAPAPAFYGA